MENLKITAHITHANYHTMKYVSLIAMGIAIFLLGTDFFIPVIWNKHDVANYKKLDIVLAVISMYAVYIFWFLKTKKSWLQKVNSLVLPLLFLLWSAVFTGLDYKNGGLVTYLVVLLLCVFFLYLNLFQVLVFVLSSYIALYVTLYFAGNLFVNILPLTFLLIPILVISVLMSIRNYKNKKNDILNQEKILEMNNSLLLANESLENKVAERTRELLNTQHKTEESKEQFAAIFNNSTDAIRISQNGISVMVNQAFLDMFGYDYENEIIGKSILENISPKEHEKIKQFILKRNIDERIPRKYETLGVRKNGGEFPIEMAVGTYSLNNLKYSIGIIRDISERKQTLNQLISAKEKAEESDRLKTSFLQNMSHEIRTPMNAIMGFSGLLVKNYNNKSKLEKFSEIINQRCADLLEIINDILDIAKIESGQLTMNNEPCDLNALFAEIAAFFKEQQKRLGKEHIKFNLLIHSEPLDPIIITDKVKLRQIFINLISNAFKFTQTGAIEGGYKFDSPGNLMFYVSDTGIGIPLDKQQFIFERFTQVEQGSNRVYSGTGLGLPIVKGLVNLLGGEIFIESEPGKGSKFSFTIPYKTAQILNKESFADEATDDFDFHNKTILIVEDDKYNAEYIQEILSDKGLNIILAVYGSKAIELAASHTPDLVLMDIRLPDISGFEATKKIIEHNPNIKIIAQTAYASYDDNQKALRAGCIDYISKPINRDLLFSLINKYLT